VFIIMAFGVCLGFGNGVIVRVKGTYGGEGEISMLDGGEGLSREVRMVKKFLVAMGEDIAVLVVVRVKEAIGGCQKLHFSGLR
jgi:hypothetical protein